MGSLDVSRSLGVKVRPGVAPNGIPAPTDEKIHDDKNPNDFVIDSNVHGRAEIIRFERNKLQAQKFLIAGAPITAREGRALPRSDWRRFSFGQSLGRFVDRCRLDRDNLEFAV